jgi:hypothetical protein
MVSTSNFSSGRKARLAFAASHPAMENPLLSRKLRRYVEDRVFAQAPTNVFTSEAVPSATVSTNSSW